MWWLIFLAVYLLSALKVFRFIRIAHYHPKGRWRSSHPNWDDKFFTFMPFINTIMAVMLFGLSPYNKDESDNIFNPNK